MVGVQRLDVLRAVGEPSCQLIVREIWSGSGRESVGTGLIGELPCENRRRVAVSSDNVVDIFLVLLDDSRLGEKVRVIWRWRSLVDVDVHSTVISPVICQGENARQSLE